MSGEIRFVSGFLILDFVKIVQTTKEAHETTKEPLKRLKPSRKRLK
jgi:hypothetical protein